MEYKFSKKISDVKGSAIREIFKYASDPEVISLAGGNPAPELFPNEELADIAYYMLKNEPIKSLQYGITEGMPELREKIKEVLKEKENISFNSELKPKQISKYCRLGINEESWLKELHKRTPITSRGYHRICKLARTIADLEQEEKIQIKHLSEAICYRGYEKKFWEGN
jgi:hypothetical protein